MIILKLGGFKKVLVFYLNEKSVLKKIMPYLNKVLCFRNICFPPISKIYSKNEAN